jgi:hypothetical protein
MYRDERNNDVLRRFLKPARLISIGSLQRTSEEGQAVERRFEDGGKRCGIDVKDKS